MKTAIISIIKVVCETLCTVSKAVTSVIGYLNTVRNDKIKKEADEAHKKADKSIEEACDSGSLSDLIDSTIEKGKANSIK